MSAKGHPEREYRSAKHEGGLIRPPGRPKGKYRSALRGLEIALTGAKINEPPFEGVPP